MERDENKKDVRINKEYDQIEEGTSNMMPDNPGLTKPKKEQTEQKKKRKPRETGVRAVLGGFIGGLIAVTMVLLLNTNNMIPLDIMSDSGTAAPKQTTAENNIVTTMASENDADIASNIEEVSDAVVGVINLQKQDIWTPNQEAGSGSGIIYKKEDGKAYIVTNAHVVAEAEEVEIVLQEDERIQAKVLGIDRLTDLAVLQIDGNKITTVANLGSSEDLKVGETVMALGNPLGTEFANSLTKGIISGLNRSINIDTNGDKQPDWVTEVIQTDAAINPGNSGGALIDSNGNVIGINSMKIARQEVEGIGFAIPIDAALPIMEQLEKDGEVARPFIGISTASLNQVPPKFQNEIALPEDVEGGMVIANVETGSPADQAGLQQFDVITKINGEDIKSILELRKYMYSETMIGDTIEMEIYRDGEKKLLELELAERDSV